MMIASVFGALHTWDFFFPQQISDFTLFVYSFLAYTTFRDVFKQSIIFFVKANSLHLLLTQCEKILFLGREDLQFC